MRDSQDLALWVCLCRRNTKPTHPLDRRDRMRNLEFSLEWICKYRTSIDVLLGVDNYKLECSKGGFILKHPTSTGILSIQRTNQLTYVQRIRCAPSFRTRYFNVSTTFLYLFSTIPEPNSHTIRGEYLRKPGAYTRGLSAKFPRA